MTAPLAPTMPVVRFTVAGLPEIASAGSGRPYTVVFDGTCNVCKKLVKVLNAWDRRNELEVVPSQTPGVMARFPWIPPRAYAEAVQLIGPGGTTWQGSEAIEELLNILPKGKLLGWVFRIPFVRGLADRFYKWFAQHRYQFGCGSHCQSRPVNVLFEK